MTGGGFRRPLPVIASEAKQSRSHKNKRSFHPRGSIQRVRPEPAIGRRPDPLGWPDDRFRPLPNSQRRSKIHAGREQPKKAAGAQSSGHPGSKLIRLKYGSSAPALKDYPQHDAAVESEYLFPCRNKRVVAHATQPPRSRPQQVAMTAGSGELIEHAGLKGCGHLSCTQIRWHPADRRT
jgi:hypothetical protein